MSDDQSISLEISDPAGRSWQLSLASGPMVIGRSPDAQVRLESPTVSRRHAQLFADPFRRWWVRDLGSRNGTRVNGVAAPEQVIHPGDILGIGEYNISIVSAAQPAPPRPAEKPTTLTVLDGPAARIAALREMGSPQISAAHLHAITDFGRRILHVADPTERMRELCRLMLQPDFRGRCATIMRLALDQPQQPPHVIVPPQAGPQWNSCDPHISRSLLSALRSKREPLIAANTPSHDAMAGLSIAPEVMTICAVACPLRTDPASMDVLYAILGPECASAEWLALASLACKQFEQAESVWAWRAQQEAHAAIERDLEQARQIQKRLLPAGLSLPGLDLAIAFEPCRWVGGDYVDVLPTPDGRVLLAIADVCGKGLPAALVASSVHTSVRVATRAGMSLPALMRTLGDYLSQTLSAQSFVTMTCLILDPKTGQAECANAGHPPPLLIDRDGNIRALARGVNFPLGLEAEPIEVEQLVIPPDQFLLLFTDGLTDLVQRDGHTLGEQSLHQHLRTLLSTAAGEPASHLATRLSALLDELQGDTLSQDDRTFLLARRVEGDGEC